MTSSLRFGDYVHHLMIDGELTILDERQDCYHLLNSVQTLEVISQLDKASGAPWDARLFPVCSALIRSGVLVSSEGGSDLRVVEASAVGVGCYSADATDFPSKGTWSVVLPSAWLTFAKLSLAIAGLHRTLQLCRAFAKRQSSTKQCPLQLTMMTNRMKVAASFSPFKAKCLERSIATFFWASSMRIPCRLRMGVQRYNFLAHAWVASEDGPIGERPDLENLLPVLVEI